MSWLLSSSRVFLFWFFVCGVRAQESVEGNEELQQQKQQQQHGQQAKPVNVHVVCHTHDDAGWLKTVDQYYAGSNNSIQHAGVEYILDSVFSSLEDNSERRFIYAEQSFFWRWWQRLGKGEEADDDDDDDGDAGVYSKDDDSSAVDDHVTRVRKNMGYSHTDAAAEEEEDEKEDNKNTKTSTRQSGRRQRQQQQSQQSQKQLSKRRRLKELVRNGQLSFVNGGWVMHDEAAAHFVAMVDQTALGHAFIADTFGPSALPTVGWQIDPFGHSSTQASLLTAQAGFSSMFFGRIDYQDHDTRMAAKEMETVWRASDTLGEQTQILAGAFQSGNYGPPTGFCFDTLCSDPPVQDDESLTDYNVLEKVKAFTAALQDQADHNVGNNIMITMGTDFTYENANAWFKNVGKLIHHVNNQDGRFNMFYSTPANYTAAKHAEQIVWKKTKTDDFFPYASSQDAYWTGYFTSRPNLKRMERVTSGYLQAARVLQALLAAHTAPVSVTAAVAPTAADHNPDKVNVDVDLEGKVSDRDLTHADVRANDVISYYSSPNRLAVFERAQALIQHHDGVSGTSKQHVAYDYAMRLDRGYTEAQDIVNAALGVLAAEKLQRQHQKLKLHTGHAGQDQDRRQLPSVRPRQSVPADTPASHVAAAVSKVHLQAGKAQGQPITEPFSHEFLHETFHETLRPLHEQLRLNLQQCKLLNESICPPTQVVAPEDEGGEGGFTIVVFNPQADVRTELLTLPVRNGNGEGGGGCGSGGGGGSGCVWSVTDSLSNAVPCQVLPQGADSWQLAVAVEGLQPLKTRVLNVRIAGKSTPEAARTSRTSTAAPTSISTLTSVRRGRPLAGQSDFTIENEWLQLVFSGETGRLSGIWRTFADGSSIFASVDQSFNYYRAFVRGWEGEEEKEMEQLIKGKVGRKEKQSSTATSTSRPSTSSTLSSIPPGRSRFLERSLRRTGQGNGQVDGDNDDDDDEPFIQRPGAYVFRPESPNADVIPIGGGAGGGGKERGRWGLMEDNDVEEGEVEEVEKGVEEEDGSVIEWEVQVGSLVSQVKQVYNKWCSQTIRLTRGSIHAEFVWTVGPVPIEDGVGKEVITRFKSGIASQDTFYTDSNGREFMKRVKDFRPTWSFDNNQPVAGNYYPVTSAMFIRDEDSSPRVTNPLQLTVLTDRAQGGSSLKSGQMELMVHRRLTEDDDKGVDEPLNETSIGITHYPEWRRMGEGIIVTGTHYLLLSEAADAMRETRLLADRVFAPVIAAFAPPVTTGDSGDRRDGSDGGGGGRSSSIGADDGQPIEQQDRDEAERIKTDTEAEVEVEGRGALPSNLSLMTLKVLRTNKAVKPPKSTRGTDSTWNAGDPSDGGRHDVRSTSTSTSTSISKSEVHLEVLLRIAHRFARGEDETLASTATVELDALITEWGLGNAVVEAVEMNLMNTIPLVDVKPILKWKTDDDEEDIVHTGTGSNAARFMPRRKPALTYDDDGRNGYGAWMVEIGPMEIVTLRVTTTTNSMMSTTTTTTPTAMMRQSGEMGGGGGGGGEQPLDIGETVPTRKGGTS